MKYRDLDGKWRAATDRPEPCAACGMPCHRAEYHPYIACQMFKQVRNGDSVRANLYAVFDFGFRQGQKSRPEGRRR